VPPDLTNVVAITAGASHSLALRGDGTVIGWGDDTYSKVSGAAELGAVVAISAGIWHNIALMADGRVVVWGESEFGQTAIPVGLSNNVIAVAAGSHHNLALTIDGNVVAWGFNGSGQSTVPSGVSNVVAIAGGYSHSLALKADGTVLSWGLFNQSSVPPELSNVVAIAAGWNHSLALKSDGAVVSWGSQGQSTVPPGLNNAVMVAAGNEYSLALTDDGTIVNWGTQPHPPPPLSSVVSLAGGANHGLALLGDAGPFILAQPTTRRAYVGEAVDVQVRASGSKPLTYQWRKDNIPLTDKTNSFLHLSSVQRSQTGGYSVVVANPFGSVTSHVAGVAVVLLGAPAILADTEILTGDVLRRDHARISMSTSFSNGTIFYSDDGTIPTFDSQQYQGPFEINQTTTIRAVAYSEDFTESAEDGPYRIQILPTYRLARSVIGQGSIQVVPNVPSYDSGTTVSLSATSSPGWRFVRWIGDVCGSATGAAVLTDGDKSVTAVFEQIPLYVLTATTLGGGAILGNISNAYTDASLVSLTAQPAPGWQFIKWQGDATGDSPDLAVIMDRPMSIQAVFGTTLSTTVGGSGTVTLYPPEGPYAFGSVVRVAARPSLGAYFAVWGSAGGGRANPLDFVVTNANPTVSALFTPLPADRANLYADIVGLGTVAVGPALPPYPIGTTVTLTASPSPGWRFLGWQGQASGSSTSTTVLLDANKTVTAIFEMRPRYALVTSTPGGGVILGNSEASYADGSVVSLSAQPLAGWEFLGWQGDETGTTSPLQVQMDRDKAIQAVFGTMLQINVVGPGSVSVEPPTGPYPRGSRLRLTATPNPGAAFSFWHDVLTYTLNPLEHIVTTPNPSFCAMFTAGVNSTPPSIVLQPMTQSVIDGRSALLYITPAGASPFAYQWRKDGATIAGATAAGLAIASARTDDTGDYDVVVSNAFGSITSAVARLTVVFPPSITLQPTSTVVASGTTAALVVTAGGTEPITYQWRNSSGPIPDATNAVLSIDPAFTNHAGSYVVVVSNPYGASTSQVAVLTVFLPTAITSQPIQQVVPFRGVALFNVQATGYPAPQFQWLFGGVPVNGQNSSSLVITNVGTNALGQYSVIVSNGYSAATSAPAMLVMSPSIRSPFLGATVVWGKSATLFASAVGSGDLTYQWFKDGNPISHATGPILDISTVALTDAGLYSLVVSSVWGSVTNPPAQVIVNPAGIALGMYAGIEIDGVAGYTYGIQYTTNLRDTNSWVNATNLTLETPLQTWIDFESVTNAKRFYRVIAR
jgi:hypothetical protein